MSAFSRIAGSPKRYPQVHRSTSIHPANTVDEETKPSPFIPPQTLPPSYNSTRRKKRREGPVGWYPGWRWTRRWDPILFLRFQWQSPSRQSQRDRNASQAHQLFSTGWPPDLPPIRWQCDNAGSLFAIVTRPSPETCQSAVIKFLTLRIRTRHHFPKSDFEEKKRKSDSSVWRVIVCAVVCGVWIWQRKDVSLRILQDFCWGFLRILRNLRTKEWTRWWTRDPIDRD